MMDNKENTDQEPNQLEVQRMPVILSYPDLCESGCSFRCDDPLSFTEIQFVLPNGEKHNQLFTAKTTIQEVREYVRENLRLPFGDFTLSTTSPQFDFRVEHFATSLGGFGLVPFTVLTVRPNMQIRSNHFTNAIELLGSFILSIIFIIMIIVYRIYETIVGFLYC